MCRVCERARRRNVEERGSDEVAVVSEISTPKEVEEPLLTAPMALIVFSREGRKAQQPPIPVSLEESMIRMLPFSFGGNVMNG